MAEVINVPSEAFHSDETIVIPNSEGYVEDSLWTDSNIWDDGDVWNE